MIELPFESDGSGSQPELTSVDALQFQFAKMPHLSSPLPTNLIGVDMTSLVAVPIADLNVEKYGVDSIQKVLGGLARLRQVGQEVFADGKLGITDVQHLPEATAIVWGLIAEINKAVEEVKDLSPEEFGTLGADLVAVVTGHRIG